MPSAADASLDKSPTQIKGALLKVMLEHTAKSLGPEAYARALSCCSLGFRDAIEHQGILNGTWHDVAWANELTLSGYGASEQAAAACRQFGRDCIAQLLTGVHRFMLKPFAPTIVLRNADKFFRTYYRGGIVTSGSTGPREGYIVASGFDGIVPELWYAILGGSEVILEAAGAAHATLVWDERQSTAQQVYAAVSWS